MNKKSYGKINLSLEVLSKRNDGFHDIDTIMQFVDIYDEIAIEVTNSHKLEIICDLDGFPKDESNLIYKGWDSLRGLYGGNPGIRVTVNKNLPMAAGMGGGSSNCACVMEALNEIWKLGLSKEKLEEISSNIGSDVPYFFENKTLRAKGRGVDFYDMIDLEGLPILIINSGCEVSTSYVYSNIKISNKPKMDILINSLNRGLIDKNYFFNDMTKVSEKICPEINIIMDQLYEQNAVVSLMSGSGSTVFGIFSSFEDCNKAYLSLKDKYKYVFNTKTIRRRYEK
ncbi:MAG: 4-(cytidine 5'-diphospho)-2-C-methyl-D-erythritol kinase [Lagierella massiliensis]|nr:4-(cytidine 5'-diphospho)-2-C-methyl-D-erythritol kinase [Lagierella massiliensis]